MTNLQDFRQTPEGKQYNDLSDQQLSDAMYQANYSDMPRDQYNKMIGFNQPQPSLIEQAGNIANKYINQPVEQNVVNPLNTFASGFNQGLMNVPAGIGNLGVHAINGLTGSNITPYQGYNFAPHNLTANAGELASYFSPMGAEKIIAGIPRAAEAISGGIGAAKNSLSDGFLGDFVKYLDNKVPSIGKAADATSNAFQNPALATTAKSALWGAVTNPNNQLQGGLVGGLLGAAAPIGQIGYNFLRNPYGGFDNVSNASLTPLSLKDPNFIKNQIAKISPEKHADAMMQDLSQGSKTLDQNNESLGNDIRNKYDENVAQSKIFYNHSLSQAGDKNIYNPPNPLISTAPDNQKIMLDNLKKFNLGDLQTAFEKNTNFRNAHFLQSAMGDRIGALRANPYRTGEENAELRSLQNTQGLLQGHMQDFMDRYDKTTNLPIGPSYNAATDFHRDNVTPYLSDKKLIDVTKGGQTNVENLHTAFSTPTDYKLGEDRNFKIGETNKIMQDLPPESKNKILFGAIGGPQKGANALADALSDVYNKGYEKYFSPEMEQNLNALNQKIGNKALVSKIAKKGIIGAGGLLLTHHFL